MGRLDHFVLYNNHKTKTTTGDNMSKLETPSITLSRGYGSSHTVWANMHRETLVGTGKRVYGRIIDTGVNYVVEGLNMRGQWVRVPCRRLPDAQVLIAKVMSREQFNHQRPGKLSSFWKSERNGQ